MLETTEVKEFSLRKRVIFEKNQIVLRDYIEKRQRYLQIKGTFDIFLSVLVVLFIFSWLFPILFLLIKLDSKGPVFFIQKRVGFLGRSFPCLKFRTMHVNDEANIRQADENDPRITRIGKFLRKSNLDELPQFLNVLAGHMSIVGPRPHMHRDCINFSKVVETYKFRHLARPGITGLAQVKGYRGPAHDFERIFKRYQWDAFYIRNANFWLDLRIIRKTSVQTIAYVFTKLFALSPVDEQVPNKGGSLSAS
jgi:putative colanic acid biosynthesis UDP-glucose lipid carrier transferase